MLSTTNVNAAGLWHGNSLLRMNKKTTLWSLCGYSGVKAQCAAQENGLTHDCYQAAIQNYGGRVVYVCKLSSHHRNNTSFTPLIHLPLTTHSSSYQPLPLPPSFFLSVFLSFSLTPHLCLAGLIHLCSLLPKAKKFTYGTFPWHPHLHFADWGSQWRTRC